MPLPVKIVGGVALLVLAGAGAFSLLQPKAPDIPLVDASAQKLAEHYDAPQESALGGMPTRR